MEHSTRVLRHEYSSLHCEHNLAYNCYV